MRGSDFCRTAACYFFTVAGAAKLPERSSSKARQAPPMFPRKPRMRQASCERWTEWNHDEPVSLHQGAMELAKETGTPVKEGKTSFGIFKHGTRFTATPGELALQLFSVDRQV